MNDAKVLVNSNFVNNVRMLLIRLAQTDNRPPSERGQLIESHRQYCEGYLGIDRSTLAAMNPADVEDVLRMTGFLPEKDDGTFRV